MLAGVCFLESGALRWQVSENDYAHPEVLVPMSDLSRQLAIPILKSQDQSPAQVQMLLDYGV